MLPTTTTAGTQAPFAKEAHATETSRAIYKELAQAVVRPQPRKNPGRPCRISTTAGHGAFPSRLRGRLGLHCPPHGCLLHHAAHLLRLLHRSLHRSTLHGGPFHGAHLLHRPLHRRHDADLVQRDGLLKGAVLELCARIIHVDVCENMILYPSTHLHAKMPPLMCT